MTNAELAAAIKATHEMLMSVPSVICGSYSSLSDKPSEHHKALMAQLIRLTIAQANRAEAPSPTAVPDDGQSNG